MCMPCYVVWALERENGRGDNTVACQARVFLPSPTPAPPALDIGQLKESLWTEMRQEIEEQVCLLGKTIVEVIRSQVPALSNPKGHLQDAHLVTRGMQLAVATEPFSGMNKDTLYVGIVRRLVTSSSSAP